MFRKAEDDSLSDATGVCTSEILCCSSVGSYSKVQLPPKICMLCFAMINSILLTFDLFGSCLRTLAFILVSDFLFYVFILLVPCALKY